MAWAELSDCRCYYELLGQGEPLILIPGLGATSRMWDEIAPDLAQFFTVIQFDNRGMGQSEARRVPRTMADLVSDIVELFDYLQIDCACAGRFAWRNYRTATGGGSSVTGRPTGAGFLLRRVFPLPPANVTVPGPYPATIPPRNVCSNARTSWQLAGVSRRQRRVGGTKNCGFQSHACFGARRGAGNCAAWRRLKLSRSITAFFPRPLWWLVSMTRLSPPATPGEWPTRFRRVNSIL